MTTSSPVSSREPIWKAYEQQIYDLLRAQVSPDSAVTFDSGGRQKLEGHYSNTKRQIDVIVRSNYAGLEEEVTMIVDCKCISRTIDVTQVETFAGLVEDVKAPLGMLVTTRGFSPAAIDRANGVRGMILKVVQLDAWQELSRLPLVTISHTRGSNFTVVSYHDGLEIMTRIIDNDLGRRLMALRSPEAVNQMFGD
jgi:hypothetical protein